ncbi:CrcB family protein [Micromonospora sp. HM5-17]|nr:CrcB family protein [Micromonospora sp. HM5-17]ROT34311.1 CrcB family protein [Micromonospora sp. HM5-17]
MTWLLVALGGAAGAACRFGITWLVEVRSRPTPWGTFVANLAGSFLLGLLGGLGAALPGWVAALLGIGFCGALTTWSTFAHESVRLARTGPGGAARALLIIAATLALGLGAAALGWLLGERL